MSVQNYRKIGKLSDDDLTALWQSIQPRKTPKNFWKSPAIKNNSLEVESLRDPKVISFSTFEKRGNSQISETNKTVNEEEDQNHLHSTLNTTQLISVSTSVERNMDAEKEKLIIDSEITNIIDGFFALNETSPLECHEIVREIVSKWFNAKNLTAISKKLAKHRLFDNYGRTTQLIGIPSKQSSPSEFTTALCCEVLNSITLRDSKYRNMLHIARDALFQSVYQYPDINNRKDICFENQTWFSKVKDLKEENRKLKLLLIQNQIQNITKDKENLPEDDEKVEKAIFDVFTLLSKEKREHLIGKLNNMKD